MQRRTRLVVTVGVVGVIAAVIFKPWLLFVNVRVDDVLPTVAATSTVATTAVPQDPAAKTPRVPSGPIQLAEGVFISHEHQTSGTVRIIQQPDGSRVLTLENLETSNGPDVHVWLSAAAVVEGSNGWFTAGSAAFVDLGVIKGNQGNQVYQIPADLDLSKFQSVSLWCVQFSVSFGAAQLTP